MSDPQDDKISTAKCFEVAAVVKEKKFEENPRRHWSIVEEGLQGQLLEQLIKLGVMKREVTHNKNGEYIISLRIWAMFPDD